MKKILMIVLLLVAFCTAYSEEELTILEKNMASEVFSSEIDFKTVGLADALSLLSKTTNITLVAESAIANMPLDLYIGRGKNLKEVVETLKATNNLKTKEIGKVLVFLDGKNDENTIIGKVTTTTSENGLNGVEISLLNSGLNIVTTKYEGIFIIENANPGTYILKAEKEGYEVAGELVEVIEKQKNYIEIMLKRERIEGIIKNVSSNGKLEVDGRLLGQVTKADGTELITERVILKHAFPQDVKSVLETSIKEIEVGAFDKLNMVIIKGTASNLVPAKKLIEDLDIPLKQVRITAQILDVTDNLFENLGFDWYYSSSGLMPPNAPSQGGGFLGLQDSGGTIGIGSAFSTAFGFVQKFNGGDDVLGAAVDMLQTTQDLAISAVPSVVIVNGEEAEFKITDEVIVGQEEVEEDSDISRTTPLFEEAGIIFRVKPTIREGIEEADTVLLEVNTEVSNFNLKDLGTAAASSGTYNEEGGSKSIRSIRTRVNVKSGESLFIGGLKRAEVYNSQNKIPLLGDLPLIGFLFRKENSGNEMRDIFIKIKAEIVTTANAQNEIELDGFKNTELHRMERDVRDHRKIYPRLPERPQVLGTPNLFSE